MTQRFFFWDGGAHVFLDMANFNPSQKRIPKGQPGAGQWAKGEGGAPAAKPAKAPAQKGKAPAKPTEPPAPKPAAKPAAKSKAAAAPKPKWPESMSARPSRRRAGGGSVAPQPEASPQPKAAVPAEPSTTAKKTRKSAQPKRLSTEQIKTYRTKFDAHMKAFAKHAGKNSAAEAQRTTNVSVGSSKNMVAQTMKTANDPSSEKNKSGGSGKMELSKQETTHLEAVKNYGWRGTAIADLDRDKGIKASGMIRIAEALTGEALPKKSRTREGAIAVINGWRPKTTSGQPVARASSSKSPAASDLKSFASGVKNIASGLNTPPFQGRVAIAQVYEKYKQSNPGSTLEQFKRDLIKAAETREIQLGRLDMPERMEKGLRERSETPWGSNRVHFVITSWK